MHGQMAWNVVSRTPTARRFIHRSATWKADEKRRRECALWCSIRRRQWLRWQKVKIHLWNHHCVHVNLPEHGVLVDGNKWVNVCRRLLLNWCYYELPLQYSLFLLPNYLPRLKTRNRWPVISTASSNILLNPTRRQIVADRHRCVPFNNYRVVAFH